MTFIYTRAKLKSDVNSGIFGKSGMLTNFNDVVDKGVREANTQTDLRSAIRKVQLAPNLYNGIFDYLCPADLAANKIIDIPAQAKRSDGDFDFVTSEDFDMSPEKRGRIAIADYNGTRVLKINSVVDSKSVIVSELDSLTSGSSDGSAWQASGGVEDLSQDIDDYIKGNGSIKFNIDSTTNTKAGIKHESLNPIDLTDYFGGTSSFFVWAKINSITNITNFTLHFGTDSSNYYSKSVTSQADGTAFVSGWNLLKFDISSYGVTGSPTDTNIKYFDIFMTKATGKINETDYKFDWLCLKRGVVSYTEYYTKYGWISSTGVYKENSTDDSDLLVADKDEYDLILEKCCEIAAFLVKEFEAHSSYKEGFKEKRRDYLMQNPSKAKILTVDYHNY